MARTGRPATPPEKIAEVRDLLAHGCQQSRIAAATGVPLRTVERISQRHGPRDAELAAGEERCEPPVRCEHGHLCTILPCRTCTQMPNRLLLDRLAAAEQKAERAGFAMHPPRRKRTKRPYELESQLRPAEQKRLEEIQKKRTRDCTDATDS